MKTTNRDKRQDTKTANLWSHPKVRPRERHRALPKRIGDHFTWLGSVTTALEILKMELDPRNVDLIIERWQTMTGVTGVLGEGGLGFDGLKEKKFDCDKKPITVSTLLAPIQVTNTQAQ
ncbi:MAG: hypothetical protein AAF066_17760 [Pseudomonadota bacterium]